MTSASKIGPFSALKSNSRMVRPPQEWRRIFARAIGTFARWAGLRVLTPETTRRLYHKDDEYIFCFGALISDPASIMIKDSSAGRIRKERYLVLLKYPALANHADLFRGLQDFLGNFTSYMPQGSHRVWQSRNPGFFQDKKQIFDLIDRIIAERDLKAKEEELRSAAAGEEPMIHPYSLKSGNIPVENFEKRIAYFRFCLGLFELLVEKHGIDPNILWR